MANELDHIGPTEWVTFTRRTNDPKLAWLQAVLTWHGIPHRRHGSTAHAPILQVAVDYLEQAWDILDPWDDVPDDSPWFHIAADLIERPKVEYP